MSTIKEVATVARETGTVAAVESLAKRVRLSANSVVKEGSLGAGLADVSVPPGAEEISWGSVVRDEDITIALSTLAGVSDVA